MENSDSIRLIFEDQRAIGWNNLYSGMHWSKRKMITDSAHELFFEHRAKYRRLGKKPLSQKVKITITAFFKNQPLDPDNIASKFYIDSLKGWLLVDDNYNYISSVTTRSIIDKDNRIEINIDPES